VTCTIGGGSSQAYLPLRRAGISASDWAKIQQVYESVVGSNEVTAKIALGLSPMEVNENTRNVSYGGARHTLQYLCAGGLELGRNITRASLVQQGTGCGNCIGTEPHGGR
jgi:hypothetical protein